MWSSHQERTNTPISKSVMTIVCKDSHKMMNHAQKSMSIVIYLVAMIQMISANKLVKKKRCNMRYQCARNHVNRKWKVLSLLVKKQNTTFLAIAIKIAIRLILLVITSVMQELVRWDSYLQLKNCNTITHANSNVRLIQNWKSKHLIHALETLLIVLIMEVTILLIHVIRHASKIKTKSKKPINIHLIQREKNWAWTQNLS